MRSLQGYARAGLSRHAWPEQTLRLQVGEEYQVHVGDWADLRIADDYFGDQMLHLTITGVDGDTSDDWQTLAWTER